MPIVIKMQHSCMGWCTTSASIDGRKQPTITAVWASDMTDEFLEPRIHMGKTGPQESVHQGKEALLQ